MKNIAIISPTVRDRREIRAIKTWGKYDHNYIFYGNNPREDMSGFDPEKFIKKFLEDFKNNNLDGIFATHDYPGSILASILTEKLRIPGPGILPNLLCQHKYYSRIHQKKASPDSVPELFLIDPADTKYPGPPYYPVFIKPVKSFFSIFASRIDDQEKYDDFIISYRKYGSKFSKPLNILINKYSDLEINADHLIAEKLIDGKQITLEGFVYKKEISILGITDSIMYPGTISFKRFEYPTSLPAGIQERMIMAARSFISMIGFDNGIFNIEFFYDPVRDTVKIIEANPRMASQFADLMEKVEGINTYTIQIDLCLGKKPSYTKKSGKFKYATSFVLRSFKDKKVMKLPGNEEISKVHDIFPEARIEIYGKQGALLSDELQDMQSYRYGIINLGGNSRQELKDKFKRCRNLLKFTFKDC